MNIDISYWKLFNDRLKEIDNHDTLVIHLKKCFIFLMQLNKNSSHLQDTLNPHFEYFLEEFLPGLTKNLLSVNPH